MDSWRLLFIVERSGQDRRSRQEHKEQLDGLEKFQCDRVNDDRPDGIG